MSSITGYRERARELRLLAQATIDAAVKTALLRIAEEYEHLARSSEIAGPNRSLLSEGTCH